MQYEVKFRFLESREATGAKGKYNIVKGLLDDKSTFSFFVNDSSAFADIKALTQVVGVFDLSVYQERLSLRFVELQKK